MIKAIEEYLELLCRTCGASTAKLRFFAEEHGTEEGSMSGEPVLEICGGVSAEPRFELGLRESAGVIDGFGVWRLDRKGYGNEWCIQRRLEGMSVRLDLEMNERSPLFMPRRLSAAGDLLVLLERLVPMIEIPTCGPEQYEQGEVCAFDPPIIGISKAMAGLRDRTRKVAAGEIPVLVCGESGTGKELVAKNIHSLGPRSSGPFIAVNCMEMPENLLQGELFGSAKGAYTGAFKDREGLVECARGGTFFLDEIGELPIHLQASLLRVLQEREIRRLGEGRIRRIDVRFVFATNRDLKYLVRCERFREDLYYRLNAVRLCIPPLRERREDIPVLAARFLMESARRAGGGHRSMTAGALSRLVGHDWPGNVRELRNEVERVVTMNPSTGRITASMLEVPEKNSGRRLPRHQGGRSGTLPEEVMRLERRMIISALEAFGGNRTRTAKALGITRQGLLKKLKRMDIDPDLFGGPRLPS